MKEIIKSIKENPRESIETVILMTILPVLFYISMWVFY